MSKWREGSSIEEKRKPSKEMLHSGLKGNHERKLHVCVILKQSSSMFRDLPTQWRRDGV